MCFCTKFIYTSLHQYINKQEAQLMLTNSTTLRYVIEQGQSGSMEPPVLIITENDAVQQVTYEFLNVQ